MCECMRVRVRACVCVRACVRVCVHPCAIYIVCRSYTVCCFDFQVHAIRLVGMLLIVYAKNSLRDYITDVEAETVGTGVMGVMVSVI